MASENMEVWLDSVTLELLSADFGTSSQTLFNVIDYGAAIGVFRMENPDGASFPEFSDGKTCVTSPLLDDLLRDLLTFREKDKNRKMAEKLKNGSFPEFSTRKTLENSVIQTENAQNGTIPDGSTHSRVEYSKNIYISDSPNPEPPPLSLPPQTTLPEKESAVAPPPAPKAETAEETDPRLAEALELVNFCAALPALAKIERQLTTKEASSLVFSYGLQAAKEAAAGRDGYKGCENYTSVFQAVDKWAKNSQMFARSNPRTAQTATTVPAAVAAPTVQRPTGWTAKQVTPKAIAKTA